MDANGIQTALLSLSCPGVYFGDAGEARDLARRCNEFSAELKDKYPDRFGMFAVLPMPFTELACREAVHALDVLRADGVALLGSTAGKFLGDPGLDELMAELDRRQTVLFVHPNLHSSSETLDLKLPGFFIEFLCDTTRAAVNLIVSGTVERYPNIRWILAHAGGFLPYIAWRISLANLMTEFAEKAPQRILTYVRRFYYDTALSPSPYAMAALKELVDPSHILFGSDFPFAPAPLTAMQTRALDQSTIWNDACGRGINRGNVLSLFPRFQGPAERVAPRPFFKHESFKQRLRRAARRPLLALIDGMRNR